MRSTICLARPLCAFILAVLAAEAQAVGNSLFADGRPVFSNWFRQPQDLYSGTAYLSGPVVNGMRTSCSGTLIAPRAILTAAHCRDAIGTAYFIDDTANGNLGAFVGISVIGFVPHPSYSSSGPEHDLAIAFLKTPAPAFARISKVWVYSGLDKPYSGTVFMGGYGLQRDPATGVLRSAVQTSMQGMIDGVPWTGSMPRLNVGSNHISHVSSATSAALVGRTDFDRWFPDRKGALRDQFGRDLEGEGFDYDRQRSPYGWTQRLVNGQRVFVGGGVIWYPHHMESATLSGDSGSAVFYNPRALVENVLWHTAYDDMVALGGEPDDSILFFLKTAYQDDTNYIVGVTSSTWTPASAGCSTPDCFSSNALASNGGGNYTLVLPKLAWINSVLAANGAGSVASAPSASTGADSSGSYVEFPMSQASLEPDAMDLQLQPAPGIPQLAAFTLTSASVAGCRTAYGNVRLTAPAPPEGLSVTVWDTLAAAVPPTTVRFKSGVIARNFTIKTSAVSVPEPGEVNVTFGGTSLSRELTVRPMGVASLSLSPTSVVGGNVATATAKLDCAAGPGPVLVTVASTNPAVANPVAGSVLVPAGIQNAGFQIVTGPVGSTTKPKISASANGVTKSRTLAITAN